MTQQSSATMTPTPQLLDAACLLFIISVNHGRVRACDKPGAHHCDMHLTVLMDLTAESIHQNVMLGQVLHSFRHLLAGVVLACRT